MPRGLRKKTKQYDVFDRFQEEDPEAYYHYKTKSTFRLTEEQMDLLQAINGPSPMRVQSLLNQGIDVNFITCSSLTTPLHEAVSKKSANFTAVEKIVGLLLFFGADPNARDSSGKTPFHLACAAGNVGSTVLMIQAGAFVNDEDDMGVTPLEMACSVISPKSDEVVKTLLENGADLMTVEAVREPVIHTLIQSTDDRVLMTSDDDLVKARSGQHLLRHGGSSTRPNQAGLSPICHELLCLQTPPHLLEMSLLEVLLLGGASLDMEPESFNKILNREIAISALIFIVSKFNRIISRSQLFRCIGHLVQTRAVWARNATVISQLEGELESSLSTVLSLSQLSRISVRHSLQGHVMSSTEALPIPVKIKHYILSFD